MKIILKILKVTGIIIVGIIALVVIGGTLFINLSPQFGGSATQEQKEAYAKSGHYDDKEEIFINAVPTAVGGFSWDLLVDFIKGNPEGTPDHNLVPEKVDSLSLVTKDIEFTKVTWFGHSAFLLQMDGKNILLDPMLGESPSPSPLLGTKRYAKELPIEIEKLPVIDAIIFSHDHYDHLDYESVKKLMPKVKKYYVPLGLGNHLTSWGIEKEKVKEMNWWEETDFEGIQLVLTPSRHFSGRGISDRYATLWGSWVINGKKDKVYFSGDGGYAGHFKEIGEKYGPFDLALLECGQYNEKWSEIHMMPEQTIQAGLDLQAKRVMPIHWGAFTLALHSWKDPIERASKKAEEVNLPLTTPKVGETFLVNHGEYPTEKWWKNE
ncbi:MAG: hypothetical protein GY827_02595 [Cytophagales bacterium]|nr:hypothetical protein [Cytophagales bacterium]